MANYMKSEFYRILHGKAIYSLTLTLTGAAVFVNVVLYWFTAHTPQFGYGTVHYTFGLLISAMQFFYIGGMMVAMFLSTDVYKSGVLKNTVAGGMGRIQIFIGKCLVYGITATGSAAVVLAGFIASALLLLGGNCAAPSDWLYPLQVMLMGAAANLPFSLACVVLTVALCQLCPKESLSAFLWALVVYLVPIWFQVLGIWIPACARIAGWMPWNFMSTQVKVSFADPQIEALWMQPQGFLKCVLVGVVGMVVFGAAGILGFRKKDIP